MRRLYEKVTDATNEARQYRQMYLQAEKKLRKYDVLKQDATEYRQLWQHALKSFQRVFVENNQLKEGYQIQQMVIEKLSKELTDERNRVRYVVVE